MTNIYKLLFSFSICGFTLTFFLLLIINNSFLMSLHSLFGLFSLFFALLSLKFRMILVPAALIASSILINIVHFQTFHFDEIMNGVTLLGSLIIMLVFLPIVSWILYEKEYVSSIISVLQIKLTSEKKFYFSISFVIQLLSFFLLVGIIPLTVDILDTMFKKSTDKLKKYLNTIILRSYALGVLWVISTPTLIISINMLNAPIGKTIIQGFIISLFGIILSYVYSKVQQNKQGSTFKNGLFQTQKENLGSGKLSYFLLLEIAILFILLISWILAFNLIFNVEILIALPLSIIIWSFFYYLITGKLIIYFTKLRKYVFSSLHKKAQELSIFLSAGIFLNTINTVGWGKVLFLKMYSVINEIPFINLLSFLPFIILFLGFLGITPSTSVVLIGGVISNVFLPYPAELVVLSLSLGCIITFFISPINFPVIILSASNRRSAWENSFLNNWGYAIIFYIVIQIYIQLMI